MQVLVREVLQLYNGYRRGEAVTLKPLPIQYKDYAAWQQQELSGEQGLQHRQYWLGQFSGELPVLELPSDRPRPAIQTFRGDHVSFVLPPEAGRQLGIRCREQGATLFMGLLALVQTLLYRYTGQADLVIGSPVAGREHPDLEGQIGYYLNTIALRTRVDGTKSFTDLLNQVKQTTLGAFSHQVYPFDRLVEELRLEGETGRSPLFDVAMVLQNIRLNESQDLLMEGVTIENVGTDLKISKGDLRFQFMEQGDRIEGNMEYNTDLYNRERIERMALHLETILSAIIDHPHRIIRKLQYASEEESLQAVKKESHFISKISEDY